MTKAELDKELRILSRGVQDAGDINDDMAFDIADGWLCDFPGAKKAIKKAYPNVTDFVGFVADRI